MLSYIFKTTNYMLKIRKHVDKLSDHKVLINKE